MHLSQNQNIATVLQLKTCGGFSCEKTIFKKSEGWLEGDSDHIKALNFVAKRKNMDRYHSIMDFVFCELFTEYRKLCFNFYNSDREPILKNILTRNEIEVYDRKILQGLKLAYELHKRNREESWKWFRTMVLKHCA